MLHESWVPHDGVDVFDFHADLLHYSYHATADHQRQFAKFSLLEQKMLHVQAERLPP